MTSLNESLPRVELRPPIALEYIPPCTACAEFFPNSTTFPPAVIVVDTRPLCRIHATRTLGLNGGPSW